MIQVRLPLFASLVRHGSHLGKIGIIFEFFLATQALLKCDPVLRVPGKFCKFHKMSKKIKDAVVYGWGVINF